MTTRRPPVSVADVLTAAAELRADAATTRAVAELLGLAVAAPPAGPPRPPATSGLVPSPPTTARGPRAATVPAGARAGALARPSTPDPRVPRRPVVVRREGWTRPPRPVPGPVEALLPATGPDAGALPDEPLFAPGTGRAVVSALAGVARPGPDVDVDALVDRVARREPLVDVPRRAAVTTRLGVQLLLDHGPSMGPFRRDLRLLVAQVRRVVAPVDALALWSGPAVVQPYDSMDDERPYTPPAHAGAVVLASDLGIGDPVAAHAAGSTPAAWLRLGRAVARAGSPLVVLVPYPPARWPAWAAPLALVRWDRGADVGSVVRAARRAAEGARR